MKEPLNENNFVRLAKALMDKHQIPYEQALGRLTALRLHIVCNQESLNLAAYQAALLTTVNCGGRSFLGGVHVCLPNNMPILLPKPIDLTPRGRHRTARLSGARRANAELGKLARVG